MTHVPENKGSLRKKRKNPKTFPRSAQRREIARDT